MSKERIAKWDNIKFVLIACVVVGHMLASYLNTSPVIQSIYCFIYTFHMPAFIFISGMMMKNTVKNKRYDKIFVYLTMGVVIKLVMFLAKWIALGRRSFELFDMDDVSWYAFAIFAFALMTTYLQRFSRAYIFVFAIVIALAAGYDRHIGTYLTLSRIFVFYPFFLAGFYLDREKLLDLSKNKALKAVSALVIIADAVACFVYIDKLFPLLSLFKAKSSYNSLDELRDCGAPLRLAVMAAAFLMTFAIVIIVPNVKSFFTTVGSRTLSIYTLHFALIYLIRDGLEINRFLKTISPTNYGLLAIIVAFAILFVTAIKPVNTFVTKLINPKLRETKE